MSLSRYAEYKDSGVEWLGEVPAHWEIRRLSCLAQILSGYPFDASLFGFEGIPVIRMSDFVGGHVRREDAKRAEHAPTEAMAETDDILLGLSGSISNFAIVKAQDLPVAVNQRVAIVRKLNERLGILPWLLQSQEFAQQIIADLPATTILNISMGQLRQCRFSLPTTEVEQTAIATFLDRETAKIDGLIAEQENLIALLAEKRQATISHAVTKGLNPAAPMTDSGVAWLGEVPAHWDIRTIAKATTKITNGYVGPTRDILIEEGIPYVQATHIKGGCVNFGHDYFVSNEWSNAHAKSILEEGDVLIVQTGAGTGDVGLVSSNEAGFNCHALIILSRDKSILHGSYLSALLQSAYGRAKLTSIQTGAMHPHLNCGEVKFVEIPLPSLKGQAEIISFLDTETTSLDALTAEATRGIALLKERRSALISAAVTGKIDVRHLAEAEAA